MVERAPVEVLAADVGVAAIDDEIFRVQDAGLEVEAVDLHVGSLRPRVGHVGVLLVEELVDEQAHVHAARGGGLELGEHGVHVRAGRVAHVELREVDRPARAADHLEPHVGGVGHAGEREVGLARRRLDELGARGLRDGNGRDGDLRRGRGARGERRDERAGDELRGR